MASSVLQKTKALAGRVVGEGKKTKNIMNRRLVQNESKRLKQVPNKKN